MMQLRPISLPLWCVYRDGVLVAGFTDVTTAAAYEEAIETEADALALAADEATPIGEAAADAVTVDLFARVMLDDVESITGDIEGTTIHLLNGDVIEQGRDGRARLIPFAGKWEL